MKLSTALTWEELADVYDESHCGMRARTLPMDAIFEWVEEQKDKFKVSKEGTIHKILTGNEKNKAK